MPIRKTPLVTNQYYHIFNRSVGKIPIFNTKRDFARALDALNYYHFKERPFPYSEFIKKRDDIRNKILKNSKTASKKLVEVICFCLMPNHFHLILKQLSNHGIMNFIRYFQNSYAKYYNIKYERFGSLFQNPFKAVLIEDDSQLLHLSRYIHLNPYSSFIIKKKKDIILYPESSLSEYLKKSDGFCRPGIVLDQFGSAKEYLKFVLDRADYQRSLEEIKHLVQEHI